MSTASYWCEQAVVDGALRQGVAIQIESGRFSSVAPNSARGDGAVRLAGLTVPGFANVHSHAFHRALRARSQADSGTFWTWRDVMYAAAERLNPCRYHQLARAVFAEMVTAGMSVVGEFHYVHHQPDGTPYDDANAMGEALLAAATDAGIRITLLDTLYLHGGLEDGDYVPLRGAQVGFTDGSADAWAERVDAISTTDRQQVGAAIHSVRAVHPAAIETVGAWARERDARLHAHVSEQVTEVEQCLSHHGRSPIQVLADAGALTPNFTAIHATHADADDVELLAASGCSVCMCPTTERDLGDGLGPISEFARAGIELSLGSDSHAIIDPLVDTRTLELHERLRTQQRGLHAADELLAMATVNGHQHLGWDDAGTISVGMRADLTTVALDTVRTAGAPPGRSVETAIFAGNTSDITSVVIDGRVVIKDGAHVSINVAEELTASIEELLGA